MAEPSSDQVDVMVGEFTNTKEITDGFGFLKKKENTSSTGTIAKIPNGNTSYNHSARMVTERHAIEYNMGHKHRGIALIFNHEHFDVPFLTSRIGADVDCENLERELKELDFDVIVHKDCNIMELRSHIRDVALRDHTDNDCILIAILSHGELGYIYAKDTRYTLETIWTFFTPQHCPTLEGKPKLFFIQACRGTRTDPGVFLQSSSMLMHSQVKTDDDDDDDSLISYKIPLHADFLFAYSTIYGFTSWRNTKDGSWFMKSLCAELSTNGKTLDILTLLTFVCRRVAVDFESFSPDTPDMHQQKQIPCITTMLTRILRFSDKTSVAIASK